MAKVGLFYGSTTGKTEAVAEAIQAALGGENVVALHEISDVSEELADYDCLIIGCPTWDVGELQSGQSIRINRQQNSGMGDTIKI